MRKVMALLLMLTLIFALTSCSLDKKEPPQGDVLALASSFIETLAAEDFEEAYAYFDTQMKSAMSLEQLEDVWDQLLSQVGPFVREAEKRQEAQPPYQIVIVTVQMGEMYLDTRVVFNQDQQIAGLFFQPSDYLSQYYQTPDYADPETFTESEVTVGTGEWALPGTITVPNGEGPFPFVVLVHGSGPNDRNETIGPNRPFQDLAWGLATQGIGVLRYDKRTKTHALKLANTMDTLTPDEEVVADAVAAIALLKETSNVDPDQIFVLGHSLGGMLAPRIARESSQTAGMIILAGTPRGLEELLVEQVTYLLTLQEEVTAEDQQELDKLKEQVALVQGPDLNSDTPAEDLPLGVAAPYWIYLREYDALGDIKAANVPVLILQGERDYQVTMKDFRAWQEGLEGESDITYRSYAELNHLFMAGDGPPNPEEYMEPANVAVTVIEDIAAWISE